MFDPALSALATQCLQSLRQRGWQVATAESCTGGLVSAALTAIPGSSDVVLGGFVTYSNRMKADQLLVPTALLQKHGAVCEPVAAAMAEGARKASGADVCVAITGVAGPGGGSAEKPVGMVCFAVAAPNGVRALTHQFGPLSRDEIRRLSVVKALDLITGSATESA
jgi:nicotinamide-nucleotide amidase